jgi:hypothetical protein
MLALRRSRQPMSVLDHGMPGRTGRSLTLLALLLTVQGAACAPEAGFPDTDLERSTLALRGSVTYGQDCNQTDVDFLERMMFLGRTATESAAFRGCIANYEVGTPGVAAPYIPCAGDPFRDLPPSLRFFAILNRALSPNPLTMHCTGPLENASAGIGDPNQTTEEFAWGGIWLRQVQGETSPGDPAWPFSQAAAIAWHEVMHQYGFRHGINDAGDDKEAAKAACGIPPETDYDFQSNSLPYIVQACMQSTLSESGKRCPGGLDACGPGQVQLLTSFSGDDCTCIADPRN